MRNFVIVVLIAALAFALWRLGDVDRQRYAMLVGLCDQDTLGIYDMECLESAEPRTSRIWDIYYGLIP